MDRLLSMDVFLKVADLGGFAAAARALDLSPTMVGKHIRFLEDRLGVRLLNRTTRRQSLTEAGRVYLERCRQLLAEAEDVELSVQALRAAPRGVLRVASPVTFGTQGLVPALADYLEAQPEVQVELVLQDRAVDLVEEGLDAMVHIGDIRYLRDASLKARPLGLYHMLICAAPEYLARHGVPLSPGELAGHACLGFAYWDRRDAWRLLGPEGEETVPVHSRFTATQGQALRMAALAGMGIVMQPELLLAEDVAAGRLVRLLPGHAPPARPIHLLYAPDRRITPKLRSFLDFMATRFKPAED